MANINERTGFGFERWLQRRREKQAEKAAQTSDDQAYEAFVDAATGAAAQRDAGRVFDAGEPSGADLTEGLGDDQAYKAFRSELSGEAGRQRAIEAEKHHLHERELQALRDARMHGRPLPVDLEHLRPRLSEYGF